MAAGFRIRQIKTERALGDQLKRARIRRKISIAEVEEATKIRAKFILALESDSWEQIPSAAYGRGYLERYALFLQLPVDEIMKHFERERSAYCRLCQEAPAELAPPSHLTLPRFFLTPRFVLIAFVLVGIVGFGVEVYRQVSNFTQPPFLELVPTVQAQESNPAQIVISSNTVSFSGHTAIGAHLKANGVEVPVGPDGAFSINLPMHAGLNEVVFEASNGDGKVTTERRAVVVR